MHAVDVARTHEILARYRPIAPKPLVNDNLPLSPSAEMVNVVRVPTRSTRTRKRGRGSCASSFASQKRSCRSTYVPVLPSPIVHHARGLPILRFSPTSAVRPAGNVVHGRKKTHVVKGGGCGDEEFLTLSLLPYSYQSDHSVDAAENDQDLNSNPDPAVTATPTPTEKDLLGRLHKSKTAVIVPHPVRPVGSSVVIGSIKEEKRASTVPVRKTPSEVEEEAEFDGMPVVVSDSHNRVRLANSAYKELVGQPECSWLETMIVNGGAGKRRIGGEVMLDLSDGCPLPVSCNRFSCKVKIEWTTCNGQKKLVMSPCDVTRLSCPSKDYLFSWRFRTGEASE